ncbi:hypothetical protein ACFLXI_06970 [Chloroflexota bacterium]
MHHSSKVHNSHTRLADSTASLFNLRALDPFTAFSGSLASALATRTLLGSFFSVASC